MFEGFDPKKRLVIDCETISWDDSRGGLKPYHGDRVCGVSVVQGTHGIYIPLRHRTAVDECLPFDYAIEQLRKFAADCEVVCNLNVKFDFKVLAQDNVFFPKAKMEPLEALARVVYNNYFEYSLDFLTEKYNKTYRKEGDEVAAWLQAHDTKDYGACPIPIMGKYAVQDGLAAYELYEQLMAQIKAESLPVWEEEIKFCRNLLRGEHAGFEVDKNFLLLAQARLATQLDKMYTQIKDLAGYDLNPASPQQVDEYFVREGIEPVKFNEQEDGTKTNSWSKEALTQIIHPMADLLMEFNSKKVWYSTFALGWYEHCAPDGKLHANFKQSGTRTGRISSAEPNTQNPPPWIYKAMRIPDGYVGFKYDYSQIEYRIFAEYSRDEGLLGLYDANPRTDFHQIVADRLHVSKHRGMVKPVNFGILYGMGEGKTKRQLAKTIHDAKDPELLAHLQREYGEDLTAIATNFLRDYHRRTPAIRNLQKQIKEVLAERGCLRNMFGRFYYVDYDKAYTGLNYICQGSAADMFKKNTNRFYEALDRLGIEWTLVTNIHDSLLNVIKPRDLPGVWTIAQKEATQSNTRVPILIDGDVALDHWKNYAPIKSTAENALCALESAPAMSLN